MLLIANESIRLNPSLIDVVREMSFSLSFFKSSEKFAELMAGDSRRVVILCEADINADVLRALQEAKVRTGVGVIVAADRAALRSGDRAGLVERLNVFENIEWVGQRFDFDGLSAATRRCRRRMLLISRQEVFDAFEKNEFVLRYQPKVERADGADWTTCEAEALVRWKHPQHGLMGPLEFLPEIEAFGLMSRLSELVLRQTAQQLNAWRMAGLELSGCINLASSQLYERELAENYASIVQDAGLSCSSFTFEVVEQDLANPDAPHLRVIEDLREKGFRICLDDFRIAASSLSTFERLPFDEIKIHASALNRAQEDRVAMTVLAAVTGLAHNLGMSVCAEGVEDQRTFDFLKTIECDKMQGFLISEAVIPSIIQRVYGSDEENVA